MLKLSLSNPQKVAEILIKLDLKKDLGIDMATDCVFEKYKLKDFRRYVSHFIPDQSQIILKELAEKRPLA